MKTTKISMLLAAAALTLTACNNASKTEANENLTDSTMTTVDTVASKTFYGVYEGTLPAADCEGIKTTLQLNDDTTYGLTSVYLGEKDGTFEYNGVYEMPNDSLIMLITPSSGEKTYYRILDEQTVMLSDSLGTINQGELAVHYTLKKK